MKMSDLPASASVAQSASDNSGNSAAPAHDDLLDCLLSITAIHGDRSSRAALLSGLPLPGGRLVPSLFGRAAKRAGFASRVLKQPLESLNGALFPMILLLDGDHACVLHAWSEDGRAAQVTFPELDETVVTVSKEVLQRRYLGIAIAVRPIYRPDVDTPAPGAGHDPHWFWGVMAENRGLYRDVLVAALLLNLLAIAMPLFLMNVYDRVVPNHAIETLWVLVAGITVVLLGDLGLRSLRTRFIDLAGARADVRLSAYIMERVLGLQLASRPHSAGAFAANLRSFEAVRDFIGSATVVAFVDLPFALLFLLVMGWIAWQVTLPFAVGVIALIGYALFVQRRMRRLAETVYHAGAQRNACLIEGLVGIETIKSLSAESGIQRKWEWSTGVLARVGAQLRTLSGSVSHTAAFTQQLVGVTIIVLGVHLIEAGAMSAGALIACYMLSSRAMAPVGQVAGLLVQYHTASTALASLEHVLNQDVDRPAGQRFINRGPLKGAIEFRNVSFAYPGQNGAVLKRVSLSIKAGERVAILGRVGSGKSTIEKLILGLYQTDEGQVLVDGIDIRQLDPAELRRQIGYVQQDVMLFQGSLRDNIRMGVPMASDAAVLAAARVSGLEEWLQRHPRGVDMQVGERGECLSGGQRQAVAIARAVIADPVILLLDEPTSAMDHSTEALIKQRLANFAQDKTLLVVTHRPSLLDWVDRIIVMDSGRVVADGPKAAVLQSIRSGQTGAA